MLLCLACYSCGYCRRLTSRLVTDAELSSTDFICDVRQHMAALDISPDHWQSYLVAAYRDYPGTIVDAKGEPVSLDFSRQMDRTMFRDTLCQPCQPGVRPRLRVETRETFRQIATLLRAIDPYAAGLWGVRAANDGPRTPRPSPRRIPASECPYPQLMLEKPVRVRM